MGDTNTRKKRKVKTVINKVYSGFDFTLFICVLTIAAFGVIVVYSSTADKFGGVFLKSQLKYMLMATVGMVFFIFFDYHTLYKPGYIWLLLAFLSGFLIFVNPAGAKNGAIRAVDLGPFTISVVELAKTFMILFTAFYFCHMYRCITDRWIFWISYVVATLAVAAVVYKVNDNMSTALIICGIAGGVSLAVKKLPWFLYVVIVVGIVLAYMFMVNKGQKLAKDYKAMQVLAGQGDVEAEKKFEDISFRDMRLAAWQDLDTFSQTKGYQTLNSLYAIGSGGFIGKGIGNGTVKNRIPESQNDMAFSIVCEEFGYWGSMFLVVAYLVMIWKILYVSQKAPDLYGSLICLAVALHIGIQVFLHIAVNINFMPNTGVTLPLVSSGGSALIFTFCELGVVLGVSKRIKLEVE